MTMNAEFRSNFVPKSTNYRPVPIIARNALWDKRYYEYWAAATIWYGDVSLFEWKNVEWYVKSQTNRSFILWSQCHTGKAWNSTRRHWWHLERQVTRGKTRTGWRVPRTQEIAASRNKDKVVKGMATIRFVKRTLTGRDVDSIRCKKSVRTYNLWGLNYTKRSLCVEPIESFRQQRTETGNLRRVNGQLVQWNYRDTDLKHFLPAKKPANPPPKKKKIKR